MEKVLGTLDHWRKAFSSVGWFIPPYIQMGALSKVAAEIHSRGSLYSQNDLERGLMMFYGPVGLAAMVMHRYTVAPVIKDYRETIGEATEAHFFGLNHVAVGGLMPVIEGAGKQLAAQRGLSSQGMVWQIFAALANDCKQESISRNIGAPDEIASMMDSFASYVKDYMYVGSSLYPLVDKTNRHGILHGVFDDSDYGRPLNFYKTIAAVDFLTFVSSFRANISWLAPNPTADSQRLADFYITLMAARKERVR